MIVVKRVNGGGWMEEMWMKCDEKNKFAWIRRNVCRDTLKSRTAVRFGKVSSTFFLVGSS